MITPQIEEETLGFHSLWVVIHFTYFSIYYSRYSTCFHKLKSVDQLEKAKLYDQELIDVTRVNTWTKIKKLRRISFFPSVGIFILHLASFYFYWDWEVFVDYWIGSVYILTGALVFIFWQTKRRVRVFFAGKAQNGQAGSNLKDW